MEDEWRHYLAIAGSKSEEENRYEVEAKMWHHAIHDHADMLKSMSVDQLTQWLTGEDKQLGDSSVIHQEVMFEASPNRIYEALTDAAQFSKVSGGAPTEITPEAGGSFSCFGGMILGKILSWCQTSESFKHGVSRIGKKAYIHW